MQWFRNLNTAKKLGLLGVISVLFMASTGILSYSCLIDSNSTVADMYHQKLVAVQLMNANRVHQRVVEVDMLELLLTTNESDNQRLFQDIQNMAQLYNNNVNALKQMSLDDHQIAMMRDIDSLIQKYRSASEPVIALAMQNKKAEAYGLYASNVRRVVEEVNDKVKELAAYTEKKAAQAAENNANQAAHASMLLVAVYMVELVMIGIFGWSIIQAIANPLKEVAGMAKEIASGNLAVSQMEVRGSDEIGQMVKAINEMVKNLRDLIQKVSHSSEQVAASSEELTASSEQSAQAANQVASSITCVADGADEQLVAADEASAVVEQMSAGIQQMTANTSQVAAQSAQAADKAKEGGKAVDRAISQMGVIAETTQVVAESITKLNDKSKKIGQIVDAISGIAGQTNLLALNAAIEAARAGEQGRGFAVVAEEVRKLAEESENAAKKIAELIGEIQGDTEKTVVSMNNGAREVKIGVEVVADAGGAFREITELAARVSEQVREISSFTQQLAAGSQQIVGVVQKIDDLSKKTAGESQNVSAATEEQLASMEEIASASQALAEMAQDLQTAVAKFRV